jgi:hypothetical protein
MTTGWRYWTRGQWALRSVVALGPVVALLARTPSQGAPRLWLLLLTIALGCGWAVAPESVVGAVLLLLVGFDWASGSDGSLPVLAVLAAAVLLAAHVAALVLSYGPDTLPLSPPVVRLWSRRAVLVFLVAPAIWVLARVVSGLPDSSTVWVLGLAVALSVTVVAGAVTQAATLREDV